MIADHPRPDRRVAAQPPRSDTDAEKPPQRRLRVPARRDAAKHPRPDPPPIEPPAAGKTATDSPTADIGAARNALSAHTDKPKEIRNKRQTPGPASAGTMRARRCALRPHIATPHSRDLPGFAAPPASRGLRNTAARAGLAVRGWGRARGRGSRGCRLSAPRRVGLRRGRWRARRRPRSRRSGSCRRSLRSRRGC